MKKTKKPELVAPAGNLEKLKYAIEYGADAVYCGVPDFSLRVRINQFTKKDILAGIKYVHEKGKKIYITTNIFAHNRHIKKLPNFLKIFQASQGRSLRKASTKCRPLQSMPDAFIAADPGVISAIKKELPNANIHLSTQANCTNWRAAEFWYDLGVKRVVLGREVTLKEIKEIKKNVPKLEIEVFVHGAMCMSYSGRCMLSAWLTGRSANLGDCSHVCRWKYNLVEQKRPGEYIPLEEDQHGTYILNSKDMCLIEYVKKIADAGVDSFKIEGRAKSLHYVSTVTKAYREVIDSNYNKKIVIKNRKELGKMASRQYTTGFLFGDEGAGMQNFKNRHSDSGWEFVGEVIGDDDGAPVIRAHNALRVGDSVEIVQPSGENLKVKVKKLTNIKTKEGVESAHGGTGELFVLGASLMQKLAPMSILRKKIK